MADRFTTRVAVFVIVRNEKGEMLLQQRGPGKYLAGYWDFPSGHNELGESLQTTSIRELKEEVDLDGRPEDLKLVHIDQYFIEVEYINFVFSPMRGVVLHALVSRIAAQVLRGLLQTHCPVIV